MSTALQDNAVGGISFTMPTFTNGSINGGYAFDLPLATIQSFMTDAYSFAKNNSDTNRQFLDNVIERQQTQVTGLANSTVGIQSKVLDLISEMNTSVTVLAGQAVEYKGQAIKTIAGGYSARRNAEAKVLNAQARSIDMQSLMSLFG